MDSTQKQSRVLFSKALTPVVVSGFLTTEEIGRLVLMTSKELQSSIFSDISNHDLQERKEHFWEHLCISCWTKEHALMLANASHAPMTSGDRFRKEYKYMQDCITHWNKADAMALQAALGITFQDCFDRFRQDIPLPHPREPSNTNYSSVAFTGPRPLQYSPKDYVIVACFNTTRGENSCKVIKGKDIPSLFTEGYGNASFDQSIGTCEEYSQGLWWHSFHKEMKTVYIVRRADLKTLRIPLYEYGAKSSQILSSGKAVTWYKGECWPGHFPSSDYGKGLFHNSIRDPNGFADSFFGITMASSFKSLVLYVQPNDFRERKEGEDDVVECYGLELSIHFCGEPDGIFLSHYASIEDVAGLTAADFLEAVMDD